MQSQYLTTLTLIPISFLIWLFIPGISFVQSHIELIWRLSRSALTKFLVSSTALIKPILEFARVSAVYDVLDRAVPTQSALHIRYKSLPILLNGMIQLSHGWLFIIIIIIIIITRLSSSIMEWSPSHAISILFSFLLFSPMLSCLCQFWFRLRLRLVSFSISRLPFG